MQDLLPPIHHTKLYSQYYSQHHTTCIHVYTHSTGTHTCIVYFINLVNYHTLLVNVYHYYISTLEGDGQTSGFIRQADCADFYTSAK